MRQQIILDLVWMVVVCFQFAVPKGLFHSLWVSIIADLKLRTKPIAQAIWSDPIDLSKIDPTKEDW